MIKNLSLVEEAGKIVFPEFRGERVYMLPFTVANGLPEHLSHWQNTVDGMLDGVDVDPQQDIYLMIDQKYVSQHQMHRRPGIHVDGYWIPNLYAHGQPHGSHNTPTPPSPTYGGHNADFPRRSHHDPIIERPSSGHNADFPRRSHVDPIQSPNSITPKRRFSGNQEYLEWPAEALILASNIQASRAWNGFYDGEPLPGGDCDHIDVSNLEEIILKPDTVYRGNVTMLHQSLPMPFDGYRTLVRLNVPGWTPKLH